MELNKLTKIKGIIRQSKRVGRGIGSGKGGHTVGKGTKGQNSRQGKHKFNVGFEGGQVPLYKRLPKIGGFTSYRRKDIISINLFPLNSFKAGAEITPQTLLDRKIIKRLPKFGVKILAKGEITKKLKLKGFLYSDSARAKIEQSGSDLVN